MMKTRIWRERELYLELEERELFSRAGTGALA